MNKRMSLNFLKREIYAQYVALEHKRNLLETTDGERHNLRALMSVLWDAQYYLKQVPTEEK